MNYTINSVAQDVREYTTAYGQMKAYKVRFNESGDTIVEIAQKFTTPAPKMGDVLQGTIDMNGEYGAKFKKDFTPKSAQSSASKDDRTMYTAYAKDLLVAIIENVGVDKVDANKYHELIAIVSEASSNLQAGKTIPVNEEVENLKKEVEQIDWAI
jgi:hypothetical protein